jgi:hypothetical protein
LPALIQAVVESSSDGRLTDTGVSATDGATPANTATCTVTVTVNDDDAPTLTCQDTTVYLNPTCVLVTLDDQFKILEILFGEGFAIGFATPANIGTV